MGWSRGSELAEQVWGLVRDKLPLSQRTMIAQHFIEKFEDHDCDTMNEANQLMADSKDPDCDDDDDDDDDAPDDWDYDEDYDDDDDDDDNDLDDEDDNHWDKDKTWDKDDDAF